MKLLKPDIENKILIPFVLILILSIVTLGGVSYWTGYQKLMENKTDSLSRHLVSTEIYMQQLNEQVQSGQMQLSSAQNLLIAFFEQSKEENSFIIAHEETLLINNYQEEDKWLKPFVETRLVESNNTLQIENSIFVYEEFESWNWIIGYGINRSLFAQEVLESQKYMVLIAIVSLALSMQAAILVSYHLSKPIRQLNETCKRISQDHMSEKISVNRHDEIGQLAGSFNGMMDRLRSSTLKLLDVTRLNEDILSNITTGIITTDDRGALLTSNPAAISILNQLSQPPLNDLLELENLKKQVRETLQTEENLNHVYTFEQEETPENKYLDIMTSLMKNEKGKVTGVICSIRDISERKKIENNIETLNRLTSMGQLAAGMAHEIRNPLAGMKTGLQVLQRRLVTQEDASSSQLFDNTLYEIDRINRLITELLNFAHPRKSDYKNVVVSTVLNRSLELNRELIEEKEIELIVEEEQAEKIILVDERQLEQIFLNLIKNAIDAISKKGKLLIRIKDKVGDHKPSKMVMIEFADNGVGIPDQDIENIFHPFFSTKAQGTGLGLSVVHELVKENNGKIDVYSKQGRGTNFIVSFPKIETPGSESK